VFLYPLRFFLLRWIFFLSLYFCWLSALPFGLYNCFVFFDGFGVCLVCVIACFSTCFRFFSVVDPVIVCSLGLGSSCFSLFFFVFFCLFFFFFFVFFFCFFVFLFVYWGEVRRSEDFVVLTLCVVSCLIPLVLHCFELVLLFLGLNACLSGLFFLSHVLCSCLVFVVFLASRSVCVRLLIEFLYCVFSSSCFGVFWLFFRFFFFLGVCMFVSVSVPF